VYVAAARGFHCNLMHCASLFDPSAGLRRRIARGRKVSCRCLLGASPLAHILHDHGESKQALVLEGVQLPETLLKLIYPNLMSAESLQRLPISLLELAELLSGYAFPPFTLCVPSIRLQFSGTSSPCLLARYPTRRLLTEVTTPNLASLPASTHMHTRTWGVKRSADWIRVQGPAAVSASAQVGDVEIHGSSRI
jgi:hypothetical protein